MNVVFICQCDPWIFYYNRAFNNLLHGHTNLDRDFDILNWELCVAESISSPNNNTLSLRCTALVTADYPSQFSSGPACDSVFFETSNSQSNTSNGSIFGNVSSKTVSYCKLILILSLLLGILNVCIYLKFELFGFISLSALFDLSNCFLLCSCGAVSFYNYKCQPQK